MLTVAVEVHVSVGWCGNGAVAFSGMGRIESTLSQFWRTMEKHIKPKGGEQSRVKTTT
jgi:hypothetical protein